MPIKEKNDNKRNFFEDVYEVVKLIPKGRVTSYGAIAHYLGAKGSARMVGWAMHACPKGVPAHRVVNSSGLLTGSHHFKPPAAMELRLVKEGVTVVNNKVKDFKTLCWNPSIELI